MFQNSHGSSFQKANGAECRQRLAYFGPTRADFDRSWPTLATFGATSVECGAHAQTFLRKLWRMGPTLKIGCPNSTPQLPHQSHVAEPRTEHAKFQSENALRKKGRNCEMIEEMLEHHTCEHFWKPSPGAGRQFRLCIWSKCIGRSPEITSNICSRV